MRSPLDSGAPAGNGNRPAPPARVLVVEDEAVVALEIQLRLRQSGFTVVGIADDLAGAVAAAAQHQPDLILMDIQLPEVSGEDVTEWLKSDDDLKGIPIIAITAFAMKGDEEKIREGGCEDYIAKPISVAKFLQTIERYLR